MIVDDQQPEWNFHPGWDEDMRRALIELLNSLNPANDNGKEKTA